MLYAVVLAVHNTLRWLVVVSLLTTVLRASAGWLGARPYQPLDRLLRSLTTAIAHTQLLVGMYLYTISPIVHYYWTSRDEAASFDFSFFSLVHSTTMLTAVVLITIGSSKARRQTDDQLRFKTTFLYFAAGFMLILLAVPWPFSPLVNRPLGRTF